MARRASYTKSDFLNDSDASRVESALHSLGQVATSQMLTMCPLSAEDWLALAWAPEEREGARIVSRARGGVPDPAFGHVGSVSVPVVIGPGEEWQATGLEGAGVAQLVGVRYAQGAGELFLFPDRYKVSTTSSWAGRCEATASAAARLTTWAAEFVNHHVRMMIVNETLTRLLWDCGSLQEMRNWLPQTTTLLRLTNDPRCITLADKVCGFRPIDHKHNPGPGMRQRLNAAAGWIAGASMLYEVTRKAASTSPVLEEGLAEARYASFDATWLANTEGDAEAA